MTSEFVFFSSNPLLNHIKNRKSPTIRQKYKCFHSTVQRAKDRGRKFHFCRLPFDVRPRNVKLNLSNNDWMNSKHKVGNRTTRWSKVQTDARCSSCKKQFKQQRSHCRLKDDSIFNLRISREFSFTQFVYTFGDIPNRVFTLVTLRPYWIWHMYFRHEVEAMRV